VQPLVLVAFGAYPTGAFAARYIKPPHSAYQGSPSRTARWISACFDAADDETMRAHQFA
jgi:hypothetical protein